MKADLSAERVIVIEELLKSDEGKTLAFKESLQSLNGILKTIVAFANTAGGIIVVGIEDKTKKIVGINNPLAEEERLASAINDSITPFVLPDIEIQNYCDKQLIIINVPHVSGPCYLKSSGLERGTYIRLGSTNRVVDSETLQTLKNIARNVCFDEQPYVRGKASDLDWDAIKKLFEQEDKKITTASAVSMGVLLQHGNKEIPSLGGIILFGVDRLKAFPDAIIRCARFLGVERDNILDQVDIEIYPPFALEEAMKFVRRNTRLGATVTEARRIDLPEYPMRAIKEAITNAIVHADYNVKGVYISIAIFDDRIEVTNPGGLPFGFTMDRAMAGSSRIRNRVIAKVFYHLKWVEQWGRGLRLIVNECKKHGLATPKFEELNNQFRVTMYSSKIKPDQKIASWQKKVVDHIKKKRKINTKQAALIWGVTPRASRLRLIKLVNSGVLEKTGICANDPHGVYVLRDRTSE